MTGQAANRHIPFFKQVLQFFSRGFVFDQFCRVAMLLPDETSRSYFNSIYSPGFKNIQHLMEWLVFIQHSESREFHNKNLSVEDLG
jgi:hypothetical protein